MHVLFVHPNFPGQFGHIAAHLKVELGWQVTFATSIDTRHLTLPFDHLNYHVAPGALPKAFFGIKSHDEALQHMSGLYMALRGFPQIKPDLVVGHLSYPTLLYLRLLYPAAKFVGYFEMLPPPFWTDEAAIRLDFPPPEQGRLAMAVNHNFTYRQLHAVDGIYTPTRFQLGMAPREFQSRIRVIHDGIDCELFARRPVARPAEFRGVKIGPQTRVVTYISRGFESIRGFDIFMKLAKRLYTQYAGDILFLVAGSERTEYGHEEWHIGQKTFKQYVLSQDEYDLSRFHFLGHIPLGDLPTMFGLSDLHLYFTRPFILSWSLLQAMASECPIVASATPPVQEVIDSGVQGLLADFFDADGLTQHALQVLRDPQASHQLGAAARARVLERYEKRKCIDQLVQYFEEVTARADERPHDLA